MLLLILSWERELAMSNRTASPKEPKLDLQLFPEGIAKDRASFVITPENRLERQERFYNMPTSGSSDLVMKALGAGSSLAALPDAQKKVSHNQSITVRESGKKRQIVSKGNNTETIIEIGDIEKLIGSNKAAKKMFAFALIKMNEQAFDYKSGSLYHDEIGFSLQELVDIGYYSSTRAARRGFLTAMGTLTDLKLKAIVKKGKKSLTTAPTDAEGEGILVMFTGAAVANNYCRVMLNYKVNWQPLFQYFTILPKFAFQLGNRPFDLLYTIFYLARQNSKQVKEKGYFTISFRAIQQRIDLPEESKTINPSRDIRQPIEDAVADITKQIQAAGTEQEFIITAVYDDRTNIREYLDNGYLRIALKGLYAEPFIEGSTKQQKAIEKYQKRQEAIVDKAIAAKIAKKAE